MGFLSIKNITVGSFVGAVMFVGANLEVSAQSRRDVERERQQIERENPRSQRNSRRSYSNPSDRYSQQQVVNPTYAMGYQQGMTAGQYDRRAGKYNRSNVYRDTGSSPNSGDPSSTDYVYRQAYLQGYNDGFNGIRNY